MPPAVTVPQALRPFAFHGVAFDRVDARNAHADCPFCADNGKEVEPDKFAVSVETGQYKCFHCREEGNAVTFLRRLWEMSDKATRDYSEIVQDRGLLEVDTPMCWGVCRSVLDDSWLVPGWTLGGEVGQLYRRCWSAKDGRFELRPTPTMPHQLHGVSVGPFDKEAKFIHLHESWGNAMAWWEVLRRARRSGDSLEVCADGRGLLSEVCVLAVPNCGAVGEPLRKYLPFFAGRDVTLFFDSDHPDSKGRCAGFEATKRAASILLSADPPATVGWLRWGPDGHDPSLKDGFDVRDALMAEDMPARLGTVNELLGRVAEVPEEWRAKARRGGKRDDLRPVHCGSWRELIGDWRRSGLQWRSELSDVLAVIVACAISIEQMGENQLFMQVVSPASSAKTRMLDAILVSRKNCILVESLTGFHSGYKADKEGKDDHSFVKRANNRCWVTPEGDVIKNLPNFGVIMSQIRRIFDGSSGHEYKHIKEDRRISGMRTPWVMGATPAMLNTNQGQLGDRFLRVFIGDPEEEERREITRVAIMASLRNARQTANGTTMSPEMAHAYQRTAGYIDHLRDNMESLMEDLVIDDEAVAAEIEPLADFVADMRARPEAFNRFGPETEAGAVKEMPYRIGAQLARLATCLAVTLNKRGVDADVRRIVRKVALDSARGRTLEIVRVLRAAGDEGMQVGGIAHRCQSTDERKLKLLMFLEKVKVVESEAEAEGAIVGNVVRWKLTRRMRDLCEEVLG